jgi:hypothetical protein
MRWPHFRQQKLGFQISSERAHTIEGQASPVSANWDIIRRRHYPAALARLMVRQGTSFRSAYKEPDAGA